MTGPGRPVTPGFVQERLAAIRARGLHRDPPVVETEDGVRGRVRGRAVRLFCSNDYLGLRTDPRVTAAAGEAARRYGAGSGSSRLIAGSLPIHAELEREVASWLGVEAALVLPSGYQANLALLGGLAGRGDRIVSDRLNHASIIDGCRLSRAEVKRVAHGDVAAAKAAVIADRRCFVVGEGLYSMDGDRGPVAGWAEAGGWLLVDEAHAVGVLGPAGRGVCAEVGVEPLARVGTFGKAFGGHGAFIATDAGTRDLLVNTARTHIFTTGLPPAAAGAALAALGILRSAEGEALRARLTALSRRLRLGLGELGLEVGGDGDAPIVPVVLGDEGRAMRVSRALLEAGFFATAIRPPTVPAGTCRIRFTLSARHGVGDVDALVAAIAGVLG